MRSVDVPADLGHVPRMASARFSTRPAFIDAHAGGSRTVSFDQFADRCDRIAAALVAEGARASDRVMIVGHNQLEFVEAVFGALRAGLVAVPVDARVGARGLSAVRDSACPRAVIVVGEDDLTADAIAEIPLRISVAARDAAWKSYHAVIAENEDRPAPAVAVAPDAPAIIMHTSGSVSRPKGIILSHDAATAGLRRGGAKITDIRQRSLLALPLGHEAAFSAVKYMLAYGGTVVLGHSFNAPEFLRLLAAHRCTHTLLVPTMAVLLLKEVELLRTLDVSALQSIVIGSAACAPDLLRAMTEAFPNAVITQNYGLTECGQVFAQSYTRSGRVPFASVGKPVRGVEVTLDGDGDVGELWVKTPTMMSGQTLGTDSRIAHGWFKTGDLFSKDAAGYFYYRGRIDDMISCGGTNVFPVEVENILSQHPDVVDVCVVGVPDPIKGEVPAALVVLKPGAAPLHEALAEFFLKHGAAYARPRRICFAAELPLGTTGKIDRRAVRLALENAATRDRQNA